MRDQKALLAVRVRRGWAGVRVECGGPAWVLPKLGEEIGHISRLRTVSSAREAVNLWARVDLFDTPEGYYLYPEERGGVPGRADSGAGRRLVRSDVPDQSQSGEVLYVMDPATATVGVHRLDWCATHAQPLRRHLEASGDVGANLATQKLLTCPWGVRDERRGAARGAVSHPRHAVPGCDCVCVGWSTQRWACEVTYDVGDSRAPRLYLALEADGSSAAVENERVAQLLAQPAEVTDLYLALRSQGSRHEAAWEAARLAYASPM